MNAKNTVVIIEITVDKSKHIKFILNGMSGISYKVPYAKNSTFTITPLPITVPIAIPINVAKKEYKTYLLIIIPLLYPNAFNVPISFLSSSIILCTVVIVTNAATIKNITGNILPIIAILSRSFFNDLNPLLSFKV